MKNLKILFVKSNAGILCVEKLSQITVRWIQDLYCFHGFYNMSAEILKFEPFTALFHNYYHKFQTFFSSCSSSSTETVKVQILDHGFCVEMQKVVVIYQSRHFMKGA